MLVIIQSRADASPLCDRDFHQMTPVILEDANQEIAWHLHGCERDGCTRHWSIHEGYLDVVDGTPLLEGAGKRPCPKDAAAMYIESRNPVTGEALWRCPQTDCTHVSS
jgi:hypothetical protein